MDNQEIIKKLEPPVGKIDMVLDTDTYNEIDDQFALVYSMIAGDCLNVQAITAAPFHNNRSSGPADGMERSYEEILRVLSFIGVSPDGLVFRGSPGFMNDEATPVQSDAASRIIELASKASVANPLYVVAIGAITNVASALVIDPRIIERIVVVWLGGHPLYWPHNKEFNLFQDPVATRVVLNSRVPFVQVPCKNVAEHVKTSVPELATMVGDLGDIGRYFLQIFSEYLAGRRIASKELWDMAAIAWLLDAKMMPSEIVSCPVLRDDQALSWSCVDDRHPIRTCTHAVRDAIFTDFVTRLEAFLASR